MPSPFALGVAAQFRSSLAVDALWRAGGEGEGTALRVMVRGPDVVAAYGETEVVVDTHRVDVQTADVPELAEADTFEVVDEESAFNGVVLKVLGDPRRDSERLTWRAEARVAS
jgi:hypothetical protein